MSEKESPLESVGLFAPLVLLLVLFIRYPIPTLIAAVVLGLVLYNYYPNTQDKQQVVWTNSGEIWRISGNRAELDATVGEHCLKMTADPTVIVERDIALVEKKAVAIRFQLKTTANSSLDSFRFGLKWKDAAGTLKTVDAGVSKSFEEGSWQNVERTLEVPMKVDSEILFFSFASPGQASCWINDLQITPS